MKPFAIRMGVFASLLLEMACSMDLSPPSFAYAISKKPLQRVYQADVGRGVTTPSSFSVDIIYPSDSDSFRTQSSIDGDGGKVTADILAFQVFLFNQAGSGVNPPVGVTIPTYGPFTVPANLTGTAQTITFTNVVAGRYFVFVAAFGSAVTFNATTNITRNIGASAYTYPLGGTSGPCFRSTTGGQVAPNVGSVFVGAAPTFTVTGTPQLQVPLTLQSFQNGATIDALINVINGG